MRLSIPAVSPALLSRRQWLGLPVLVLPLAAKAGYKAEPIRIMASRQYEFHYNMALVMAEHFAIQMCRELGLLLFPGFTPRAQQALLDYHWPGNVRELKNVVERSVYRHNSSEQPLDNVIINPFATRPEPIAVIRTSHDADSSTLPALPLDLRQWQNQQERDLVEASLQQARYNQRRAAGLLGVTYHQLRAMMKKHDIKAES